MKKNVFVWWFANKTIKNFGDVLNPYLIAKLSGLNIVYVAILKTKWRSLFWGIQNLVLLRISIFDFYNLLRSFFQSYVILAIGSLISDYSSKKVKVWGTGLMNSTDFIHNADFLAVRGEYTRNRIIEIGYKAPEVIGDPALLLPLVYCPKQGKKYDIGIIPHYVNYNEATELFKDENQVLIINLFDDIEKVIDDINSCRNTISSSLHGIIVSHAYGVKSIWGNFNVNKLNGDNVKFKDYFSSVKIEEYDPIKITEDVDYLRKQLAQFEQLHYSFPRVDIKPIQQGLLKVAPFKILNKYIID